MKQINLLPKIEQQEFKLHSLSKRLVSFWIWIVTSLIVLCILALASRIYLSVIIKNTQDQIDRNNTLLNSADYKDLENQILALNRTIKDINNLQAQHYYWSDALVAFSNLVPGQMQLNSLALDTSIGKIQINGQARSRDQVIGLWSDIIKSAYFNNINFPLANLEKPTSADFTYTFYAEKNKFNSQ